MHPDAELSMGLAKQEEITMEQRLRKSNEDFSEALEILRLKLKAGGILLEDPVSEVRHPTDYRTPLEGAVIDIEYHAGDIHQLTKNIVI